jgi:hypothetical protein
MELIIKLTSFLAFEPYICFVSFRRQLKKSKSMIQLLLFGDEICEDDMKSKNIRQTGRCFLEKFFFVV